MIPLQLQLKNFLSYGSDVQTIDFSHYPLICLSGKNGHGKSALLDALTWALWGQARKTTATAKADQGLLRLGETQMMVSLDLVCNGQHYRVRREFAKTYGKPYAALDFALIQDDDSVVSLTDKTIRKTQEKIEKTLHLDFESFTNSAFLRQGQANEFSKKSPKDRKQLLANILGLDEYETIRKKAAEKGKVANNEKKSVLTLQDNLAHQLQKVPEVNAALKETEQELTAIADKEAKFNHQRDGLAKEQQQLAEKNNKKQLLELKKEQLVKEQNNGKKLLREVTTQWKQTHYKQLRFGDHTTLEKEKAALVATINKHQNTLQKLLEYKETFLQKKETLQKLEQTLNATHTKKVHEQKIKLERLSLEKNTCEKQLLELSKKSDEIKKELTERTHAINELETTNKKPDLTKIEQYEKQFEKRKNYYQQWITQGNILKNELTNLEHKKKLVHNEQAPSCPLCEQNLSASRKRFLKTTFLDQERTIKHKLARFTKLITHLKKLLLEQHPQLEQYKKECEAYKVSTAQHDEHRKQHTKLKKTLQEITAQQEQYKNTLKTTDQQLEALKKQITQAEQTATQYFTDNDDYKKQYQQLQRIKKNIHDLKYDQAAHKTATEKLAAVEKELQTYNDLVHQLSLQEQRKTIVHDHCLQLKKIKKTLLKLTKDHATYNDLDKKKENIEQSLKTLQKNVTELTQQKEQLLQKKGQLQTEQATLKNCEQEHKKLNKKVQELNSTIEDYQAIATATSKDGIQALLIEDAIPEIEQEANELLAKLTDNQAQIFIESLRDLKKGGTKETLDIKISDALGIRPYELFSGGEAFRIDFALRIAISKLLARRSGTALQTLIIDEGFGSQDEQGLTNIMDAIYKIQDDFCKVIIVSHLNSMKDQFPVHFIVNKGPNGSKVNVLEQG